MLLYLVMIGCLVAYRPLREFVAQIDPWRRGMLGVLFLLLVAGQINAKKYPTYPFVKWGMYDDFNPNLSYFEYRGIRSDGSEAPFPVAHLVRTHSSSRAIECPTCGKRMLWRLRDLGKNIHKPDASEDVEAMREFYERILRSAYAVYKTRNPEADFERVEVWRASVKVPKYEDLSSIRRKKLWEVELDVDATSQARSDGTGAP